MIIYRTGDNIAKKELTVYMVCAWVRKDT